MRPIPSSSPRSRPFSSISASATVEASATASHVTVAAFPDVQAVAVEPQTHATDGHRRRRDGERGGVAILGAGDELEVVTTLRFSQVG